MTFLLDQIIALLHYLLSFDSLPSCVYSNSKTKVWTPVVENELLQQINDADFILDALNKTPVILKSHFFSSNY